jgi:hypothetical protein
MIGIPVPAEYNLCLPCSTSFTVRYFALDGECNKPVGKAVDCLILVLI